MNKDELKRQIKLNSHLDYDKVEWRPASVYVPVVIDLIDQLDEAEKVVVPSFVAEHIDRWKKSNVSIGYAFTTLNNKMTTYGGKDADVHDWLYNQEDSLENQEIYARAWLDGYTVEKEKKYHLLLPKIKRNWKYFALTPNYDGLIDHYTDNKDNLYQFTEKEIKDYDERYWAFAKEVTE